MRVCTVQEMRELDRRAGDDYGLPAEILMENAGHAVYEVLRSEYGLDARRYVVVCGRGNNGGDGLVVARKLHSNGADVRVYLLASEEALTGAAKANLDAARKAGIPLQRLHAVEDLYLGRRCDVVVDALFGTGVTREVEGLNARVIERINGSDLPVVSVDIPSGVDGDTGAVHGVAIRATCTVTFGLPKLGNVLPPGRELCGRLFLSRISFPPALCSGEERARLVMPVGLPRRPLESHKGSYGRVLLVAGAATYVGAPALCALSFLKAGGGYVRLAAPRSIVSQLAILAAEAVFVPLDETTGGSVSYSNLRRLTELAAGSDLMVVGPGLSLDPETQELVHALVSLKDVPALIDGDGLTAVASDADVVRMRSAPTLLTPHAGEMSRLLDWSVDEVVADRVAAVREASQAFGATVLLKGSSSLICGPDGLVSVNLTGNPGMATAGCGDVLAGAIAALIGLGLAPRSAMEAAAFVHGMAGDLAAQQKGQDGMTARDVMEQLPAAMRTYRNDFRELQHNLCGRLVVI